MKGVYRLFSPQSLLEVIEALKDIDLSKRWVVKIEPDKRSTSQNKLYWMWLNCIGDETGNSADDLHEVFKNNLLKKEINIKGSKMQSAISTTKLNRAQFTRYLERIEQWGLKYNIYLPHPDDDGWKEFEKKYKFR